MLRVVVVVVVAAAAAAAPAPAPAPSPAPAAPPAVFFFKNLPSKGCPISQLDAVERVKN